MSKIKTIKTKFDYQSQCALDDYGNILNIGGIIHSYSLTVNGHRFTGISSDPKKSGSYSSGNELRVWSNSTPYKILSIENSSDDGFIATVKIEKIS